MIHYWAAITLGPLVVILVMGLAVGSQFQVAQDFIEETPVIGGLVFKMIPFFVLCGSFLLLYQLMPNTKVHWKAALVGGAVAAVLWVANGKFNALFASKVVSASKIYGSLSAIPIFLFGLYLSWTILLFGAQVSYAFQNRRAYIQEKQAESVNQRGRELGQGQEPATREEPMRELVRGAFEEIQQAQHQVAKAVTVQAMVERSEADSSGGATV